MSNNKITIPQDFKIAETERQQIKATKEAVIILGQMARKLNEADGQTAVTTADGSDAATTQALANALKVKLNELIAALQK